MSAQTLIIFVVFKLSKHQKMFKYASKYRKYPRDCILYVSDAKWVKTMKNEQSLHNWQFQSPNFQKFTKLVPEHLFWKKSQPKPFKSQKLSNIVLGWKLLERYIFGPYTLQVWQNQSLGIFKVENIFCGPHLIGMWQTWSLGILWKDGNIGPSNSAYIQNWSLHFIPNGPFWYYYPNPPHNITQFPWSNPYPGPSLPKSHTIPI